MATAAVSSIELSEEKIETGILETGEPAGADLMEPREQDEFPEIITASLAETYFDQGKLTEAREIYEKLVEKDPEDRSLKSRLDEISLMMQEKDVPSGLQVENSIRQKKEKMISTLDSWRSNIRGLAGEGVTG